MLSAAIGNITYDARGNTVAAGSKTYGYDIFNQLTSAVGSGVNASMDYDPVGRLSEVTGSGVTTKFVYSGSQMIAETNTSGTTLRRYVHGPGVDEPIVWYEGAGTTDRRWLMSDNQGSITAITDDTGAVTSKNRYNEYGVPDLNNTGRFQYTGQVWLAEADIYHYKARAYDPYLGRFLQTDPIGYVAGMNMYAYVGGDPVNYTDPTGLKDEVISTGTRRTLCEGRCITDPDEIRRLIMDMQSIMMLDFEATRDRALAEIFIELVRQGITSVDKSVNDKDPSLPTRCQLAQQVVDLHSSKVSGNISGGDDNIGAIGVWGLYKDAKFLDEVIAQRDAVCNE